MSNSNNVVLEKHLDSLAAAISAEITLVGGSGNYTLPTATESVKGGIIVGDGLAMDGDTLNVTVESGSNYEEFTGATSLSSGTDGLVPKPTVGDQDKYLRGDGTWALPTISSGGGGNYADFAGATSIAGGASGLVPAPSAGDQTHFLRGDGVWASVGRDLCTMTLSESSGSVGKNNTISFTVTSPSDGVITATSSDTNIATVSVSGNTVTVSGVQYGSATITVSQAQGFDYLPPPNVTYSVTVAPTVASTLNGTDWDIISAVSQAGTGDTYWDVGDCKEITLNGKIGDCLTLENQTLCVFILHFNYALNGTADNNIIWGGFKTALTNGTDVALCDSRLNVSTNNGTICFNISHRGGYNYGGWKGCDLRYDILGATSTAPSEYNQQQTANTVGYDATAETLTSPKADTLLAALPSDFRSVLRLWSRWIDAKGCVSKSDANVVETIDAVTLLAEFEVFGRRIYADEYEQNHQTQMAYYAAGNSTIKYNHSNTSQGISWWLASPYIDATNRWCRVVETSNVVTVNDVYAIAPAFMT